MPVGRADVRTERFVYIMSGASLGQLSMSANFVLPSGVSCSGGCVLQWVSDNQQGIMLSCAFGVCRGTSDVKLAQKHRQLFAQASLHHHDATCRLPLSSGDLEVLGSQSWAPSLEELPLFCKNYDAVTTVASNRPCSQTLTLS